MRTITLLLALAPVCAYAAPAAAPASDRAGQWQEDLDLFATRFRAAHVDFAKLYNRAAFDAEIAALRSGAGELTDAEITLRLMKLVAGPNVAHTYVGTPLFLPFHRLPLTLAWFSDGLAIIGAAPEYSNALGTHVVRIGTKTPEQVLSAVTPYIPYETPGGLRVVSTNHLTVVEILRQAGVAPGDSVQFTLAKPGGEPFTLSVGPGKPLQWKVINDLDSLPTPPLYRKHPRSYYWYEYLPDSKTLYIQYNRCQNDPNESFSDFTRGLFAFADSHTVERAVVDLRFNGGGNERVIQPLKGGLHSRRSMRVYVLMGPGTFSSAEDNAIALQRELNATLVGEPAGGKPNSYGEVRNFTLPNSKLGVQYSTHFFRKVRNADPPELVPDIRVDRTLADALAGLDPVLDAALHHRRP